MHTKVNRHHQVEGTAPKEVTNEPYDRRERLFHSQLSASTPECHDTAVLVLKHGSRLGFSHLHRGRSQLRLSHPEQPTLLRVALGRGDIE